MSPLSATGSERSGPRNRLFAALATAAVALPSAAWLWGFTVDDALISARVAAHIAQGLGPRFNPHGPPVDAVTPLGYAWLLAPLGRGRTVATFAAARWLGLGAWLAASALLGVRISRAGTHPRRFSVLAILAVNAPLAAWSGSGMETGLVTLLVTAGLFSGVVSALALGIASAWRPELIPFAVTLTLLRVWGSGESRRRRTLLAMAVSLPALLSAGVRLHSFGHAWPLSFYAKPSDLSHGLRYALGALSFTGLPWLLGARPGTWARTSSEAKMLLAALLAHVMALVLCGGDWMPLYRLTVPVLPAVAVAASSVLEVGRGASSLLRLALAAVSSLALATTLGPSARRVASDRAALIAEATPVLAAEPRIAALDVGWVALASGADVLDLAGVTDERVAFFPGGHTSKRVPRSFLLNARPTAIVLLLERGQVPMAPPEKNHFARAVEQRIAGFASAEYAVTHELHLAGQTYVVFKRRDETEPP